MANDFDLIGLQEYVHDELFGLTKKYNKYELITGPRKMIGLLYNKATLEKIAEGQSSFGCPLAVGDRPIQYFLFRMRGYHGSGADAPTLLVINAHAPHRSHSKKKVKFPLVPFHQNEYLNTFFDREEVANQLGLQRRSRCPKGFRTLGRSLGLRKQNNNCANPFEPDVIALMGDFNRPLGPGEIKVLGREMSLLKPAGELPSTYLGYAPPALGEKAWNFDKTPWKLDQNEWKLDPTAPQYSHGPDHILMHVDPSSKWFGSGGFGEKPEVTSPVNWDPTLPFNGVSSDHLPVFAKVELVPVAAAGEE